VPMAVIFDCDGVLVDSERLVSRLESALLTRWGWPLTAGQARAEFKGRAFPDIARQIEARLRERLPADWMYTWAMETASVFCDELREIGGVRSVIEQLIRAGRPLAVASQSPLPRVRLSLRVTNLARYFDGRVFTSSMVARPKPAPDLFLHAARALGVVPAACTVIEDSPSGVRAAVAAGMRVFGYAADEDRERLREAGALPFQTMVELGELLAEQIVPDRGAPDRGAPERTVPEQSTAEPTVLPSALTQPAQEEPT
jgi:HAD superfamily hydrolase (TIGR01509 family)